MSSDGRFRALRDALHRCDPPCIPYLGLYLTDLSFIEEGTPTFTPDGLLNFSKMRMVRVKSVSKKLGLAALRSTYFETHHARVGLSNFLVTADRARDPWDSTFPADAVQDRRDQEGDLLLVGHLTAAGRRRTLHAVFADRTQNLSPQYFRCQSIRQIIFIVPFLMVMTIEKRNGTTQSLQQ